jgi:major membrane immunogen (membrane-anchored lipoprotein)
MKALTLFISISLLTACGASDNSDTFLGSNSSKLPIETVDLKGSWQEPCDIDTSDNDSSKSIETYSDTGMSLAVDYYRDSDCTFEELSMKFTASINYAGEKVLSSGQTVKKVGAIIDTKNVLVLLIDESLQNRYINNNMCSRTDWNSGQYINISNCYELNDLIEDLKAPLKDIYYVDGNNVYWGNSERANDEHGFPTELKSTPNTKI